MNDFVTIATFDDYIKASLEKQKLEEHGIFCYLADEHMITIQWSLSHAMGGIKLRILEADVEKARLILSEKAETLTMDHTIENSDLVCPNCGSNNTVTEKFSKPILAISWILLGFPIKANPNKRGSCFYCGCKWEL